jgi:hypothetical protein
MHDAARCWVRRSSSSATGSAPPSRRAAGKSLLCHLKQRFANMLSTEFGSSFYCVGCGAAMVTTDPQGCRAGQGR